MPEHNRKPGARRRFWTYGLVDLLVIGACSAVFLLVVTAGKPPPSRKSAVEETVREAPMPAAFPAFDRPRGDRVRRI